MPIITTTKKMRPRDPMDHYPTDPAVALAALRLLPHDLGRRHPDHTPPFIVDPGAGSGVYGAAARQIWPDAEISGCDIRDLPQPAAYDQWIPRWDFVTQAVGGGANLVMGNPPYKFAEEFIRKGFRFLTDGGYINFLLRLSFLEGQKRARGLWKDFPLQSVHVLAARPSFTGDGRTDATAYAIFILQKGWTGTTTLHILDWSADQIIPQRSFLEEL